MIICSFSGQHKRSPCRRLNQTLFILKSTICRLWSDHSNLKATFKGHILMKPWNEHPWSPVLCEMVYLTNVGRLVSDLYILLLKKITSFLYYYESLIDQFIDWKVTIKGLFLGHHFLVQNFIYNQWLFPPSIRINSNCLFFEQILVDLKSVVTSTLREPILMDSLLNACIHKKYILNFKWKINADEWIFELWRMQKQAPNSCGSKRQSTNKAGTHRRRFHVDHNSPPPKSITILVFFWGQSLCIFLWKTWGVLIALLLSPQNENGIIITSSWSRWQNTSKLFWGFCCYFSVAYVAPTFIFIS